MKKFEKNQGPALIGILIVAALVYLGVTYEKPTTDIEGEGVVQELVETPDGTRSVFINTNDDLLVTDIDSGKERKFSLKKKLSRKVESFEVVQISPDSSLVIIAGLMGNVPEQVWVIDLESLNVTQEIQVKSDSAEGEAQERLIFGLYQDDFLMGMDVVQSDRVFDNVSDEVVESTLEGADWPLWYNKLRFVLSDVREDREVSFTSIEGDWDDFRVVSVEDNEEGHVVFRIQTVRYVFVENEVPEETEEDTGKVSLPIDTSLGEVREWTLVFDPETWQEVSFESVGINPETGLPETSEEATETVEVIEIEQ